MEEGTYDFADDATDCRPLTLWTDSICLDVQPGETSVDIEVVERSSLADLGFPVAVRAMVEGAPWYARDFCGSTLDYRLPPGATTLVIEVQHGWRAFCDDQNVDYSATAHGTVRVLFR